MAYQESGYQGRLVSLGGVLGKPGRGRQIVPVAITVTTAEAIIASDNPQRLALIIRNTGTETAYINLAGNTSFPLKANEVFQIDYNFAWTGAIYAATNSSTTTVIGYETSVP